MYTATLCTIERCHWFVAIISRPKKALSNWRGRESSQLNARMSRIRRIRPLAMGAEGQPLALWWAHKSRGCYSVTFHTQILMHYKVSINQYSLSYSAQLWHHNSKHLHSHIHIVMHNVNVFEDWHFAEIIFTDQGPRHNYIHNRRKMFRGDKFSRSVTNPLEPWKFSTSKIWHYTVAIAFFQYQPQCTVLPPPSLVGEVLIHTWFLPKCMHSHSTQNDRSL